jgi:light-regulated signal transduction histidine kinase (bacteriophytochrome)
VSSPETVFPFVIRPPWYRHPAIVLLYAIVAVLAMVGIVRLRSRALERENLRLEAVVAERTAELGRRAMELEAARGELEAFSYSVSHDLQAPLRRIEGFGQLLEEDLGPRLAGGERHLVERIRANCREMSELIDALLRLSRLGRAEVLVADVDLGAMAREILASLATGAPERRIRWSVDEGLVVRADVTLLRVVVTNLLENAVKFTVGREEARIEVRRQDAPERPGQLVVAFADNGVGFDPAYADKLFAPFARLHSEADFPGTGIGLATVRRLLHRQGGEIWAESAPDRGAVFSVAIPTPTRPG